MYLLTSQYYFIYPLLSIQISLFSHRTDKKLLNYFKYGKLENNIYLNHSYNKHNDNNSFYKV